MFKPLFGIVEDVARIALTPVEIAADLTRAVTKPIADVAEEAARDVKDMTRDLRD